VRYTKRTGTKWDRDQTGRVTRAVRAEEKRDHTRKEKRISDLLRPFLAFPKKDRFMYDRQDLIWDGKELRLLSDRGVVFATIEPDQTCPGLWRVRLPGGHLTDTVNLSRAKDAAASLALAILNRHREAA
jgi:hypothetical protein